MKNTTEPVKTVSVTFVNEVEEADIWILPQTEENLKTSLWGTATVSKLKAGEKKAVSVNDNGDGQFIVRIIDVGGAYYAASGVSLQNGYTIRFKTEDAMYESAIEVVDENGVLLFSKQAFQGVFGAR